MEADNARWLAAYNTNTPAAFPAMYTKDAVVLPPGAQPVDGRDAIGKFWEERLKPGNRKDHTFEIVRIGQDGHLAYQEARWTLAIINKTGEPTKLSGNTDPHLRATARRHLAHQGAHLQPAPVIRRHHSGAPRQRRTRSSAKVCPSRGVDCGVARARPERHSQHSSSWHVPRGLSPARHPQHRARRERRRSESRNITASAISSGVPGRPSGTTW